jgi:hypothetical protein
MASARPAMASRAGRPGGRAKAEAEAFNLTAELARVVGQEKVK